MAQSLLKTGRTEAGQKELQIAAELKAQAFKLEQATQTGAAGMASTATRGRDLLEISSEDGRTTNDLNETAKRELQSGEAYYKKIIGTAHNNIGLLRGQRQDFPAAAEQFALAAKWDPQQEGLDYNLGLAYYKSQSYKQAAAPLERALRVRPANRSAAVLLGMTLFRLGNYGPAAEVLSRVVDPQSTDVNTSYALASSLIRQGKAKEAERVIEQMRTSLSDVPQLHLLMAENYDASGDVAKALAGLSQVAASGSNMPLVHYYAGLLYLKLNKREEAAREFERELVVNSADIEAKYALSNVLLEGKDFERGLALVREVIKASADHAEARFALGKALLQRGDVPGAIDSLETASKLEPEKAEFHYQLGQAYVAAGRKAEGKSRIDISKQLRNRNPTRVNDK